MRTVTSKFILFALLAIVILIAIAIISHVRFDVPVKKLVAKYTNEASKFLAIDGMQVHYRDEGKGEPLVLLHGSAASLHTWDGWVAALSDSFRVIRPDIPGFGLTGPNRQKDYSLPAYIAFLDAFLDSLGIEQAHFAGNSLGGEIAWHYALARPQRVGKLILINASGFSMAKEPNGFKLAKNPFTRWIVRYVSSRSLIENGLKEVYGNDSKITEALIERYYEINLRAGNREAYIARAQAEFAESLPELKNISYPTLLLWGEADPWDGLANAGKFLNTLPNAKLISYPGAGHVPMEEIPEQTVRDALTFLTK